MKMKKTIIIVLVICFVLSAVACDSLPFGQPEIEETPAPTATPTPTPAPTPTPTPKPTPEPTPEPEPENDLSTDGTGSRPLRNPLKGAMNGYGENGDDELRFEVRYIFEQFVLPLSSLHNEDMIIDPLKSGDMKAIEDFIEASWEHAVIYVMSEDFEWYMEELAKSTEFPGMELITYLTRSREFSKLEIEDNILEVTTEKLGDKTTAIFLKMYATGWSTISEYLAIVYTEGEGLAYYMLETSSALVGELMYFFCYSDLDSRGTFYAIDNTLEAFKEAIMTENNIPSVSTSR